MNNNNYLSFTKRERTGIIILVGVILMIAFVPSFFPDPPVIAEKIPEHVFEKKDQRRNDSSGRFNYRRKYDSSQRHNYEEYKRKNHTSGRYNYRRGAPRDQYRKYPERNKGYTNYPPRHYPKALPRVIDINLADTAAFIALPGIGSKLAARIVLFRGRLGGFFNVLQVGEVYGLADSVFQKIRPYLKCDPALVKKLDINAAGQDMLKQHPYIRWSIAQAVIAYRSQHGDFSSLQDLEKISNIDSQALRKMIPYLTLK